MGQELEGLSLWEQALRETQILEEEFEKLNGALRDVVENAGSLDEAAMIGRELGAAMAQAAEQAGSLGSASQAIELIADTEEKARKAWMEGQKEKEKAQKEEQKLIDERAKNAEKLARELARQEQEARKMSEEAMRLEEERSGRLSQLQSATTRNLLQAGMASGQLIASMRLLGAEGKNIEVLAREFIFLQTSVQAMNQGYAIFTNLTEAVQSYRAAMTLAATAQTTAAASSGAAATGLTAVGTGSRFAAVGIISLNAAIGATFPILGDVTLALYAWRKRKEEHNLIEIEMRKQIALTTGTINARADALQRNLDLEKSMRAFQDQFREVPKTREEIIKNFEERGVENKQKLESEARRVLRNEYQEAMSKTVQDDNYYHKGKNVGEALSEIERRENQYMTAAKPLMERRDSLPKTSKYDHNRSAIDTELKRLQEEYQYDAAEKANIEQQSGIRALRMADKELKDGTDMKEVSSLSGQLIGSGQFGAGDQLANLAKQAAQDEMQRVADARDQAKQAAQALEYEKEQKLQMMAPQLEQAKFEAEAVKKAGFFYEQENKRQNLNALMVNAEEGKEYGTGRIETFNRFASFAESEGLASDVMPDWKKAKREMDVDLAKQVLARIKEEAQNPNAINEGLEFQVSGDAEVIAELDRLANGLKSFARTDQANEFAKALKNANDVIEETQLNSRATGL
jgi:hypothetical protein